MTEDMSTRQELIERKINTEVAGAVAMSELGVMFRHMGEVMEFAKMMAVSGPAVPMAFRGNPGACLAVALKAHHLGFEPFSFASKCYLVNDQLAYEAQLINAIILRRAAFIKRPTIAYQGHGPERQCIVTLHFNDGDQVYESPKFAGITPKNSPLWKTDPDQQLAYYAIRAAARRYCPDVIMGMYDQEEMAAAVARDVTPRADAAAVIAEKLANGSKITATYVGGAKPDQGPVQTEEAPAATIPAEDSTAARAEAPDARGDLFGGDGQPATTADRDFGLRSEIEVALAGCKTKVDVEMLADEFAGAIETAKNPAALKALIEAKRILVAANLGESE